MKTFFLYLAFLLISFPSLSKEIIIESTGYGITEKEATENALSNAMHSAIGSYLVSSSEIKNGILIQDKVIQHAQGKIQKYKKTSSIYNKKTKIFTTMVDAYIEDSLIANAVESVIGAKSSSSLNLKSVMSNLKKDIKHNKAKQIIEDQLKKKEDVKKLLNKQNKLSIIKQFEEIYVNKIYNNKVMGVQVDSVEVDKKHKSKLIIKYHTYTKSDFIVTLKSLFDNTALKITKGIPINKLNKNLNSIVVTDKNHLLKRKIFSYTYYFDNEIIKEILSLVRKIKVNPRINISLIDKEGFPVRSWYENNKITSSDYKKGSILLQYGFNCDTNSAYKRLICGRLDSRNEVTPVRLSRYFLPVRLTYPKRKIGLGELYKFPFNNIYNSELITHPLIFIDNQKHYFESSIEFDNLDEILEIEKVNIDLSLAD